MSSRKKPFRFPNAPNGHGTATRQRQAVAAQMEAAKQQRNAAQPPMTPEQRRDVLIQRQITHLTHSWEGFQPSTVMMQTTAIGPQLEPVKVDFRGLNKLQYIALEIMARLIPTPPLGARMVFKDGELESYAAQGFAAAQAFITVWDRVANDIVGTMRIDAVTRVDELLKMEAEQLAKDNAEAEALSPAVAIREVPDPVEAPDDSAPVE